MKKILIALVLTLAIAVPVSAQTYLSTTTLSSAVTSQTQRVFNVASAANIAANYQLYIDRELVTVVSVSGTAITVNRSQAPSTHASGATVIIANVAQQQVAFVPNGGAPRPGTCSLTAQPYLPIVDTDTGNVWLCRYIASAANSRVWAATNVVMVNGVTSLLTTLQ